MTSDKKLSNGMAKVDSFDTDMIMFLIPWSFVITAYNSTLTTTMSYKSLFYETVISLRVSVIEHSYMLISSLY